MRILVFEVEMLKMSFLNDDIKRKGGGMFGTKKTTRMSDKF